VLGTEMKHNLNNKNNARVATFAVLVATVVVVTGPVTIVMVGINQSAEATFLPFRATTSRAPAVVTGDNIYIAWWNGTAGLPDVQTDVMFRASNDGGATFSDRINLSNTTDADSWRVEIAGEGENVVVSWWETNQTSDTPVARISTDAGETFGPMLRLGTNGTISGTEEGEEGEGETTDD
jgi:hypothetical protein